MPGMSGADLAKALLQVRADLPILLVSGFVEEAVREAAEAIGVREVLFKPLSIEGLGDAVSRALAGAKVPPPA
jgi:DNA-binding NarL/FixJ family response regulator